MMPKPFLTIAVVVGGFAAAGVFLASVVSFAAWMENTPPIVRLAAESRPMPQYVGGAVEMTELQNQKGREWLAFRFRADGLIEVRLIQREDNGEFRATSWFELSDGPDAWRLAGGGIR